MEYALIAKVKYTQPGDSESTVGVVDLGDMQIQSKDDIDHLCKKISWDLNLKDELCFDSPLVDYPHDSDFYLESSVGKEEGWSVMYHVQLIDCMRVKGKLFTLQPLSIH